MVSMHVMCCHPPIGGIFKVKGKQAINYSSMHNCNDWWHKLYNFRKWFKRPEFTNKWRFPCVGNDVHLFFTFIIQRETARMSSFIIYKVYAHFCIILIFLMFIYLRTNENTTILGKFSIQWIVHIIVD